MHIYKFRELNTNNLTAIANNQLWFSSLDDFNDPFEGCHTKVVNVDSELISKYQLLPKNGIKEQQYREILNEVGLIEGEFTKEEIFQKLAEYDLEQFIKIIHGCKVVCFSLQQEPNNPLTNNLMWSHYANGLRGYCLVFDGDELMKDMYSSTKESIRPIIVQYQDQPNIIDLSDFLQSQWFLNGDDINFVEKVTETVSTKSSDWKYENEFRILSLNRRSFHCYNSNTLKEIIVGDKMSASEKSLLLRVVKASNPNIIVKTARLKDSTYQIEIV